MNPYTLSYKNVPTWIWQYMPIIPELGKRLPDPKIKNSLGYIVIPRSDWTKQNLVSETYNVTFSWYIFSVTILPLLNKTFPYSYW